MRTHFGIDPRSPKFHLLHSGALQSLIKSFVLTAVLMGSLAAGVLALWNPMPYTIELWIWLLFTPLHTSMFCVILCWVYNRIDQHRMHDHVVLKSAQLSFLLALPTQYMLVMLINQIAAYFFDTDSPPTLTTLITWSGCWLMTVGVTGMVLDRDRRRRA